MTGGPAGSGLKLILLDANLWLLSIVGDIDRARIAQCGRTRQYEVRDYELLDRHVRLFFTKLLTTPNILTEVSNLAGNALKGEIRGRSFARLAEVIPILEERYVPSDQVSSHDGFGSFGLTDIGILRAVDQGCRVLTDDHRLADYLGRQGIDVLTLDLLRARG